MAHACWRTSSRRKTPERGRPARSRRDLRRQNEPPRVRVARLDRQPALRSVAQSLGSLAHARRIHRRGRGGRRRRAGAARARLGRGGLDSHPGELLRPRRSQAHLRARADVPGRGRQRAGRPRRSARAHRARRGAHDERHRPSRSARCVRLTRRRRRLSGRLRRAAGGGPRSCAHPNRLVAGSRLRTGRARDARHRRGRRPRLHGARPDGRRRRSGSRRPEHDSQDPRRRRWIPSWWRTRKPRRA
jgi:hypothetical protein